MSICPLFLSLAIKNIYMTSFESVLHKLYTRAIPHTLISPQVSADQEALRTRRLHIASDNRGNVTSRTSESINIFRYVHPIARNNIQHACGPGLDLTTEEAAKLGRASA
jgi:hypothetical protein